MPKTIECNHINDTEESKKQYLISASFKLMHISPISADINNFCPFCYALC